MPVPFEELAGSPRIRIANGHFSATREFKIAWSDTISFAVELLGGYQNIGGTFVFSDPAIFPNVPQAICRDIEFDPFPSDMISTNASAALTGSTNLPPFALVTARYSIPAHNNRRQRRKHQPEVPAGTYLTYRGELGAESLSIPGRTFKWSGDDEPLCEDISPSTLIPTEDIALLWERVPIELAPWNAMRDARGKVNSGNFFNHGPGTVLFLGAETAFEHQLVGDVLVNLTYRFKVREVQSTASSTTLFGWNHFYRRDAIAGEHWLQLVDDDANPRYSSVDLQTLFTFEP
jgi:hypothetical protein